MPSSLKSNKATGGDAILAEILKALNDNGITMVTQLLNLIYEHEHIPEGMAESIFIQLPKQLAAVKCEKHQTISLMRLTKFLL